MFEISEMTTEYATEISKWKYDEPYSAYSMKDTEDEIDEIMNGLHVAVTEADELVGYIAFGWSAQPRCENSSAIFEDESYSDIALGLRPDLCGRGLGGQLTECAVSFVKDLFPEDGVRLTVKVDNVRAIKVYERAGFSKSTDFTYSDGALYNVMCLTEA